MPTGISRATALRTLISYAVAALGAAGAAGHARASGFGQLLRAAAATSAPRPRLTNAGMMGTPADMSAYMELFDRHSELRRTVKAIPGGVRTLTESDAPELVAQLQAHVASMYAHLENGLDVTCMSPSLPVLFRHAAGYRRHFTFTKKGVSVMETSSHPRIAEAIRAHAREVTGFVHEGMPAMMNGGSMMSR